jgi:hypothetical protein
MLIHKGKRGVNNGRLSLTSFFDRLFYRNPTLSPPFLYPGEKNPAREFPVRDRVEKLPDCPGNFL